MVFKSGSLVDAVRASISMPGIFVPYKYKNDYFVDGGVMNPVPVNIVKAMGADVVIAVNLNHDPRPLDHADVQPVDPAQTETESNRENESSSHQNSSGSDDQSHPSSQDNGPIEGLVNRYENAKEVLQENIDDWMPDPQSGINIFDVIGNSINMMEQQVAQVRLSSDAPDILIEPDLIEFGIFDFQQAKPLIQRGYDATIEKISDIKAAIE
jgi:NTE family protein